MKDFKKRRKSFAFRFSNLIVRIIVRRPKLLFLGDEFPKDKPYYFLVNHCGKKSPLKIDSYFKNDLRIWGTYEMTLGFKSVHKYLTTTYYHEKKHLPKFLAWIVGTIVCPFVAGYYKGMRIIPTYTDLRFVTTLNETIDSVKNNRCVVIFPEDSSKGYKKEIPYFYSGFAISLEKLYKRGYDLDIYVGYLIKKKNTFVIMPSKKYSELKEKYQTNDELAEAMRGEMNSLVDFDIKKYKKELKKKDKDMEKVAITYDKGNVFQHFGKTEFFKIFEIDNKKIVNEYVIDNKGITHCALIDYLKGLNVNTLICGNLGYGAVSKLNEVGIKLYAGVTGNATSAIEDYIKGSLNYDNESACEEEHTHSCKDNIKPLF
ncbi:MAG: NifB/NifX family molybdenum-iron cluster-binding protein [Acholeplasmatales bacterium]|nr:NifB/NifX family molybdenum-iron cluster-binding protein [Acholeplasmatales bacterium]